MKILQNAKKVQRALLHDIMLGGHLAVELKEAAVQAVRGGKDSDEWKSYMAIFADNEAQLQRLLGNDAAANEPWFEGSTAYLVSNGVCTSPSAAHFINDIEAAIDDNLDDSILNNMSVERALNIVDPHPESPIP